MDDEIVEKFAEQQDLDADFVRERWEGSPTNIAEDVFRIMDVDTGEYRDLKLFDPIQTRVLDAYFYSDAKTFNLYKGRRIGYSFIVCLAFLIEGMMIPNSVFPVVGIKQEGAEARISDIQDLIDNAKIDIPTEKDNAGEIVLWNGTKYKAYSGAPDSSRGDDSARAVLLDEKAFYEDQEKVSRAFGAFLALGENRKMVEVSTPKLSNDQFMETHRKGTPTGENGTLSIKQPTFHNAEDINEEISLFEQEVHPVRPDIDLQKVEDERSKDPAGFAQEYLCRPVDDSYAFFKESSIRDAMDWEPEIPMHGRIVMGVDIGIDHDDTVIAVFLHLKDRRYQIHQEVVTNRLLDNETDIRHPDRGNANHIATRMGQLYDEYGVNTVVMDRTGPGETFQRIVEAKFGRSIRGFNFSDLEGVEDMMGDLNNALRNGRVSLKNDDRLFKELSSIVKEKRSESSKPKFSGKDTSETGKDDTAFAVALATFPPGMAVQPGTSPRQERPDDEPDESLEAPRTGSTQKTGPSKKKPDTAYGSVKTSRRHSGSSRKQQYPQRYRR